jgi:adenine-specific DNA methylase
VICAALWPDPADERCPDLFRDIAKKQMLSWATEHLNVASQESAKRFIAIQKKPSRLDDQHELRAALLDFIADFANWDNSTVKEYLDTSRALTRAAHEALGGAPGTRPLVVDPFAGGGSIPLEALRVGADAFASDLNPVAVLLNVVVESLDLGGDTIKDYLTVAKRIGERLAVWDASIFAKFWSRTIRCGGPSCGVEIPLIRNGQISKRGEYAFEFKRSRTGRVEVEESPTSPKQKRPVLRVVSGVSASSESTCKNGSVTCPVCSFTHRQAEVARQALDTGFGHRLIAIGQRRGDAKTYRAPSANDERMEVAKTRQVRTKISDYLAVPINSKRPSPAARGMSAVTRYGYVEHNQLFSTRQLDLLETVRQSIEEEVASLNSPTAPAVHILLAITLDRLASFQNAFCRWAPKGEHPVPPFGKNGFPMIWDYVEASPFGDSAGSWDGAMEWVRRVLEHLAASRCRAGTVEQADSQTQMVPNDAADAWITDPPYYDSYPYADLSDFFYPILRASLSESKHAVSGLFAHPLTPKDQELVLQPTRTTTAGPKDHDAYRTGMTNAFTVGRAVTRPDGVAVIVFANKTTSGWEALLGSVCDAGWTVTASWPIDTERESRAAGQARLQSSVHLACRPREASDGSLRTDEVGDWRDLLAELPRRIHEWMPRLAHEGVVGADAIFACLGPALEIFSRYARVEKASGEAVTLKEYLVEVWAAVSREALSMIFEGADASGFEEDARLTAMWLWTLQTDVATQEEEVGDEGDEGTEGKSRPLTGYSLEYDAARKIAQGLGANLENLEHLVEVTGETATLLTAGARTKYLFGKEGATATRGRPKKKAQIALDLGEGLDALEEQSGVAVREITGRPGATVLDRLHQAMVLFGAGRGEAVRRFLVDEGVGRNPMFWRLAQALSALYPTGSEEKRWIDGVLARKKGLGL